MGSTMPPTAEGDLERTPLAHLLVYAIERHLTGALFLTEPGGVEHVIRFAEGAPVKVRSGDGHARLGELLIEAGAITDEALQGALSMKGLLGDALVLAGCIDEATLEQAVEQQFLRRMIRLFGLRPATTYRYFDGHPELTDYGAEPASSDPLSVLWAGLRENGHLSTMIDPTLARLGNMPLHLHPEASLRRFGFGTFERAVIDRIREHHESFADLVASAIAPPDLVRNLVYALTITRQLELGPNILPIGAAARSSRGGTTTPGRGLVLARLRLRSTAHRLGAAAPDLPGDGVRAPVSARSRRKPKTPGDDAGGPSSAPPRSSSARVPPPSVRSSAPRSVAPVSTSPRARSVRPGPPSASARSRSSRSSPPSSDFSSGIVPTIPRPAPLPAEPSRFAVPEVPQSGAMHFEIAAARLTEGDLSGALEACALAREVGPDLPEYAAFSVWVRSMMPDAEIRALLVEMDEIVRMNEDLLSARYYRGVLRGRLGELHKAIDDLRCVLKSDPSHTEAERELRILESREKTIPQGLLKRLLKR
jgi:hypothetical protein